MMRVVTLEEVVRNRFSFYVVLFILYIILSFSFHIFFNLNFGDIHKMRVFVAKKTTLTVFVENLIRL